MYMNLVMLAGFLGKDAVARCAGNGNFTIFELLIDLCFDGKESNEYALQSESDDLLVFGGCGEDAAIFKKGDYIMVTGELRQVEQENNSKQKSYTIWVKKLRWIPRDQVAALRKPHFEEISKAETIH